MLSRVMVVTSIFFFFVLTILVAGARCRQIFLLSVLLLSLYNYCPAASSLQHNSSYYVSPEEVLELKYVHHVCFAPALPVPCHANLFVSLERSCSSRSAMVHLLILLREQVKEMFYHGWRNYMMYAFPDDELKPLSCAGRDRMRDASRGSMDDVLGRSCSIYFYFSIYIYCVCMKPLYSLSLSPFYG